MRPPGPCRWTVVASPVDDLLLTTDGAAVTGIFFHPHREPSGERDDDDPVLRGAARQLKEYFRRDRQSFDLALAPAGTPFQQKVWAALLTIPYGQTATYGDIARRIGLNPATTARAVGSANGSNPLPIVVPCHRVIGADGTLTGFGGGLPRKQLLLDLEASLLF